jgi:hypothetical protein
MTATLARTGHSRRLEHDEMTFPRVIRATDAEGRSCIYLAEGPEGQPINIKWIEFNPN